MISRQAIIRRAQALLDDKQQQDAPMIIKFTGTGSGVLVWHVGPRGVVAESSGKSAKKAYKKASQRIKVNVSCKGTSWDEHQAKANQPQPAEGTVPGDEPDE